MTNSCVCDIKRDSCPDIKTKNMRNETSEGVKGVMGIRLNLVEGRIISVGSDH